MTLLDYFTKTKSKNQLKTLQNLGLFTKNSKRTKEFLTHFSYPDLPHNLDKCYFHPNLIQDNSKELYQKILNLPKDQFLLLKTPLAPVGSNGKYDLINLELKYSNTEEDRKNNKETFRSCLADILKKQNPNKANSQIFWKGLRNTPRKLTSLLEIYLGKLSSENLNIKIKKYDNKKDQAYYGGKYVLLIPSTTTNETYRTVYQNIPLKSNDPVLKGFHYNIWPSTTSNHHDCGKYVYKKLKTQTVTGTEYLCTHFWAGLYYLEKIPNFGFKLPHIKEDKFIKNLERIYKIYKPTNKKLEQRKLTKEEMNILFTQHIITKVKNYFTETNYNAK